MYFRVKRIFDVTVSLLAGLLLLPVICVVLAAIWLEFSGPILFWSDRVGKENEIYRMPKFRSMKVGTPAVATDQLQDPNLHITKLGSFLRRSSLDELPQLWSVLIGDMSLIGPRPALYNQEKLIRLRTDAKVHRIQPGITGWAQINGRDTISTEEKVMFDIHYYDHKSIVFDLKILWLTVLSVLKSDSVTH